jgi:carbon monoxide dehydrogenase subunit G
VDLSNEFEVDAPIERAWVVLTDVERIAPCLPGAQLQEVEGDEYRGIVKVKVGPITAQYKGAASFIEKDDAAKRAVLKADGRDTRGAGNASALITAQLIDLGGRTKVTVDSDITITGKVAQFGRGVISEVSAKLMGQFADNLGKLLEQDDTADTAGSAAVPEGSAAVPESSAAGSVSSAPAAERAPTGIAPGADLADDTPADVSPADVVVSGSAAFDAAVSEPVASSAATPAPAASAVRKIDMPEPKAVNLLDSAGAPVAKRVVPLVGVIAAIYLVRRWRQRRS